jgi:hypothetical protein
VCHGLAVGFELDAIRRLAYAEGWLSGFGPLITTVISNELCEVLCLLTISYPGITRHQPNLHFLDERASTHTANRH